MEQILEVEAVEVQPLKLKWDIYEKPIFANGTEIKGYKTLFRDDTNAPIHVAKNSRAAFRYTPTTNARFVEVVERMQEITGFPIRSYDEFAGGRKVLAFLECTEQIEVCGADRRPHQFQDFMLIANSHDSSTGFFIGNSSKMIRCENRFSKSFRQLQVNHTKHHDQKIDNLLMYAKTFMQQRTQLFEKMERFAKVQIDESIRTALVERLTRMSEEEKLGTDKISTRKANIIHELNHSINRECLDLGNNLFGLFNGVTHYTTHVKQSKNTLQGNPFGMLNDLNQTAFKFCEAMI